MIHRNLLKKVKRANKAVNPRTVEYVIINNIKYIKK